MKYRYRSDEEMKDSGVDWIGKIPKDWEVSRIDKEFKVRNEKVSDKKFEPLSVTKQGILPQLESVAKTDNGDNRKKVCIGDFVINSRADRKGSCGVSDYNGSVSLICNVLTPKELNTRYIHNLFRNYYFSEEFYRWGSGIVDDLWSTNIERMKKINIPIPIEKEQNKIAKFLDEKTSDFDNIISKKENLIEKLEDAKKSLISEVVTGKVKVVKNGEDFEIVKRDDSEMKDSGVEWIGKIPKDWEVKKIKYLMGECKGRSESGLEEPLSMSQKYGLIKTSEMDNIPNQALSLIGNKLVDIDDLVFNKLKPHLGVFSVSKYKGIVSPDYAVYRAKERVDIKYLEYLFRTPLYINEFKKYSTGVGAGLTRLYTDQLFNIYGITPDYEEQRKIKIVINKKLNDIDKTVEKMNLQIEKLKEAKQALISEAVTGKIEILD